MVTVTAWPPPFASATIVTVFYPAVATNSPAMSEPVFSRGTHEPLPTEPWHPLRLPARRRPPAMPRLMRTQDRGA